MANPSADERELSEKVAVTEIAPPNNKQCPVDLAEDSTFHEFGTHPVSNTGK